MIHQFFPARNRGGVPRSFRKAGRKYQTACKPGSVPVRPKARREMTIPLGRLSPGASRDRPGRRRGKPACRSPCGAGQPSLFGLAPGGVYHAVPVTGAAVRSYRTLSPLPPGHLAMRLGLAVCSLWHFPWGRPRRALSGTVFSVEPGLSSTGAKADSGHPAVWSRWIKRAGRSRQPPLGA